MSGISFHQEIEIQTLLDRLKSSSHNDRMPPIPTSLPPLDEALRGGFHFGCVYEVFGKELTGKTLLCLQLSSTCVEENEKRKVTNDPMSCPIVVYYFDTNNSQYVFPFPTTRSMADKVVRPPSRSCRVKVFSFAHLITCLDSIVKSLKPDVPGGGVPHVVVVVDAITPLLSSLDSLDNFNASLELLAQCFFVLKKKDALVVLVNFEGQNEQAALGQKAQSLFDVSIRMCQGSVVITKS
eukprot:PhF_6_TR11179/c0_g1_i1/m.18014